jgi:hypothetical protein
MVLRSDMVSLSLLELLYVVGMVDVVATVDTVKLRSSPLMHVLEVNTVLVNCKGCSLLDTASRER